MDDSTSFWHFLRNETEQDGQLNIRRILRSRSNFHRAGLTLCEYLRRIQSIQDGYNYQQEKAELSASMAAYLGISAFGMFVNFFTLVIMFNATNVSRPRNYLIISHMFIDCFQCSVTMPITLLTTFHFYWFLDDFSCKLVSFLKASSFYSSFITLSVLAAHQFISYNFKFNPHWFLIIFAIGGLFAVPYVLAVSAEVVDYFEPWNNDKYMETALTECNMTRPLICSENSWNRSTV
ncbi:hypothetical protein M3Y97_00001300 [Aphelenchoides bicaudatus]|nr:hypothetical protein M3Y97_00001300 [Aphelenchoides bicaudatus]